MSQEDPRAALSADGATGRAVREACRDGSLKGHTSGLAPGYAQANLVIVPKEHAFDFLLFCTRNPKPCPLLEVTDAGCWEAKFMAPGSDIRRDLPRYRVFRDGVFTEECESIEHLWPGEEGKAGGDARRDWVGFLLGCSFSFEEALIRGGVPVRHLMESKAKVDTDRPSPDPAPGPDEWNLRPDAKNVPMYRTAVNCDSAGVFSGPLVVSMRPMRPELAEEACRITREYPRVHGAPVHWGDPSRLGIGDVCRPDYGDAVTIYSDEVPVFWACGVTPQEALLRAKIPIAITHAPGHMFVTDKLNSDLAGDAKVNMQ